MGLKISEMQPFDFPMGGVEGETELLEISTTNQNAPETFAIRSQDLAAVAAPFRMPVSLEETHTLMDGGSVDLVLAKLYFTDLVRERIRYGLDDKYGPQYEYDFPEFNAVDEGLIHINLICRLDDGFSDTKRFSLSATGSLYQSNWYFSGLNSLVGPMQYAEIPVGDADYNTGNVWPSYISYGNDYDGKGRYLAIYATVNFSDQANVTFNTFGYVDAVIRQSYYT